MNGTHRVDGSKPRQFFPWGKGNATFYLTSLFLFAVVGSVVVAFVESTAIAFVAGLAAFLSGGFFGFLFGIPRYAASLLERTEQERDSPDSVKYRANTNLESISDWLTKIIVGIGLTQFTAIGAFFSARVDQLAAAFADPVDAQARASASTLIIVCLLSGFIYFYLWSRVYLPKLFADAEQGA